METTERVVEAYVRYVKGWATIPNIKCEGQYEIDLLAICPQRLRRYHIESGVSVSGSYSKLTAKPFSEEALKTRVKAAGQRRTIGYFLERKFGHPNVLKRLAEYGFTEGRYVRVIVTWGWTEGAEAVAREQKVELWDFRDIMREIAAAFRTKRTYFADDTLRTLHLYAVASNVAKRSD